MSHFSMIMSALALLAMVVFVAPGIFALNRGHILRNIALWLAIFLGLAVFYQTFGPESAHPLFNAPDSMAGMNRNEALKLPGFGDKKDKDKDQHNAEPEDGSQGFTPPKD